VYEELLDVLATPIEKVEQALNANLYKITLSSIARCIVQLIYLLTFEDKHKEKFLTKWCIKKVVFILVEVRHPGGDFSEERIFRSFELG
jgi:NhaP-type Na+/H+ and K+/H+ antiporter